MLQIILAFLAISIVSVTGYSLMEQISLQQIMLDQRENGRRLDVAAEALQASIVSMGASGTGSFAPAPSFSGGMSQMPASVGGINRSINNVPFRYCPVVVTPSGAAVLQGETSGSSVALKTGSYDLQVNGSGLVTGASLSIPAEIAAFRPVAFIISAGRDGAPSFCDEISIAQNGRARVPSGLVRIVSQPSVADVAGAAGQSISNLYVSNGATGSGRSPNDPASIQSAMRYWSSGRPSSLTIHVADAVSASGSDWDMFNAALAGNGGSLAIIGEASGASISGGPASPLVAPGNLSLQNIGLPNVSIRLGAQSSLSLSGSIALGQNAIFSSGGRRVSGSANISVPAGYCWLSDANDATFQEQGISGANSAPIAPGAEPALISDPSDPAYAQSVEAHNAWRQQVIAYQNARMTNLSNFNCSVS